MSRIVKLRILALLGLLAALPLTLPRPAFAHCIIETETFYSDATYTTQVGRCVTNDCNGTYTCTGQQTAYSKTTIRVI
jgi:hypothetical protein